MEVFRWRIYEAFEGFEPTSQWTVGHSRGITKLALYKNTLFSSSLDSTLKQWNIDLGIAIKSFEGFLLQSLY
jgi:hypothetical protein